MGSQEESERVITGWAARDPSGLLSPYSYSLRKTGEQDVYIKVLYCGICHTDIHQAKNDLGMSRYPMVPGSCKACQVEEEQYCKKKIWSYNDVYTDGKPTQGGFASHMTVDQKFVVKIPDGMASEQAAPLLCAGVTAYSPLKHFGLTRSGLRGGILGLGGVGHMGVKIAKAMGHHVTVLSSSDKKREEAMDHLGADEYVVSSNTEKMKELADSLDYIIDTVPVFHQLEPYLTLLGMNGKLILIGAIGTPLQFLTPMILLDRRSIAGSFVGSIKETEEMLEFCNEKDLMSQIEIIKMDYVNKAMERLEKNDVRYRFVIDVAGSNMH